MIKKKWTSPKLIVLVRSKPEEAVLVGCKTIGNVGPENENGGCNMDRCFPECWVFTAS